MQIVLAVAACAEAATFHTPGSVALFALAAELELQFPALPGKDLRTKLRSAFRDRNLYWREMGSPEEIADRHGE
jgi:hypothetical protein